MVSEASRVEHEYLPPTVPMIMSRYPRPALPETAWQHPEQTGGEHWGSNLPGVQPRDEVKRCLTNTLEVGASSASSARSTAEQILSLYQQQAHMIRVLQAPKFNLPVFVGDLATSCRHRENTYSATNKLILTLVYNHSLSTFDE